VSVHFTPIVRVTETSVVGGDGIERACDTIVCATGFDTSYRPRFPIVGRGNINLQDAWGICPEGYLGLAVPKMPNFIQFIGPTWPVENGSVMGPLMQVSVYAMQVIRKLQLEMVASVAPRQDITDEFNSHVQAWIPHTTWSDDCRSWYRNNETGRVNAVWPGSSLHYIEVIRTPRWEDFDITFWGPAKQNRWAFLGMGFTYDNVTGTDFSPYLNLDALDPEWIKAAKITLTPEEKKRKAMTEDNDWASGAKLGALCLAGAASVLAYSLRTMPRWRK
jgi:hydroxyversicolorone monooxygenase